MSISIGNCIALHVPIRYLYITYTLPMHYLYIHYLYITYTLPMHYLHITYTLPIHYLSLPIHYLYITYTLPIHYLYITYTVRLNKKLTFRCTKRIVLRYAVNRCVTVRHHRCFSVTTPLLRASVATIVLVT